MKKIPCLLLFCTPLFLSGQNADSLAIQQVDSLIQVSRELTGLGDYEKALEVNALAEKIALEKAGKESAAYGNVCFNYGRVFHLKDDFTEAEKWYTIAKVILEKAVGTEHPAYTRCLYNLGNLYRYTGAYEKAKRFHVEALTIREKTLGKIHADYAWSLSSLASVYWRTGNYEKAESLCLEALAIREKLTGKEHPDYAESLDNLAVLYKDMGNYEKAEPLYLQAKAIREKVVGKEHAAYSSSLNNLAILYDKMGNYEQAEALYLEALAIREKKFGSNHSMYAEALNNLAAIYWKTGNYEKAEPLYLQSLTIKENVFGKAHPDYATALQNLGVLYFDMGNYEKAEPLYLEAKTIREKVLGREHPDYLMSLYNLGNLYRSIGNYKQAELLSLETKDTWGKVLGKEHPDYAQSLINLGNLYLEIDNYEKAEPLYLEALAILEKSLGKEHPDYAMPLINLGNFYKETGHFKKAESLYLASIAIQEKALRKEHPYYANSVYNLANLYAAAGDYGKAELLYMENKAIIEKVLGKNHPEYAKNLNSLGIIYWTTGKLTAAGALFGEAFELEKELFLKASRHLSEMDLANYTQLFTNRQNLIFSFARIQPEMAALAYNNTLFHKGFLLNAVAQLNKLALTDTAAAEIFYRLKACNRLLAAEFAKPVAERKKVETLEEKANLLEKELVRSVAGYGEALRQISWQEVQAKLAPGEVAIEFVHFKSTDSKASDSTMYAALLLFPYPEASGPRFISLFEEKQLDSLLQADNVDKADYLNKLYSIAERNPKPPGKPQKSLYELLWQPFEKALSAGQTVYFSPSGLLHRLNFGAIPVGEEKAGATELLADRYRLVQLGSTRQLATANWQATPGNTNALLYGGIRYEPDSAALTAPNPDLNLHARSIRGALGFNQIDSTLWNYLPWTNVEINSVRAIFSDAGIHSTACTGFGATEESFKSIGTDMPSPRILHIATHGYFFPEPNTVARIGSDEPVFKISERPMIRCGLILAGGNYVWKTGNTIRPGMEDGILTAYEISQMNLGATELVALSACETGLGDIRGNEGVYGLQRAFKIAGVKYLIMSLWQVPDYQTQQLMTTFYANWLEKKMAIPDAFHAAQKTMRETYKHPFFWAGFVLVE